MNNILEKRKEAIKEIYASLHLGETVTLRMAEAAVHDRKLAVELLKATRMEALESAIRVKHALLPDLAWSMGVDQYGQFAMLWVPGETIGDENTQRGSRMSLCLTALTLRRYLELTP